MMQSFEIIQGSPGLRLSEVAHVFVPGRGRSPDGMELSPESADRVYHAADFYAARNLGAKDGKIVLSGYKTPADTAGRPWRTLEDPHSTFQGMPEADAGRRLLLARGVANSALGVERHSFDTVTNFTMTEASNQFGDDRPVAIAAQRKHLERMLDIIAPKTLRREYIGLVVPESGEPDADGAVPRMVSRLILLGLGLDTPHLASKTYRRADLIWSAATALRRRSYP